MCVCVCVHPDRFGIVRVHSPMRKGPVCTVILCRVRLISGRLRRVIIPQNVDRAFKLCMHIRQAPVQESLAPYDPGQCLALKKFRFQGLDFLFNSEASLQKDESAM